LYLGQLRPLSLQNTVIHMDLALRRKKSTDKKKRDDHDGTIRTATLQDRARAVEKVSE